MIQISVIESDAFDHLSILTVKAEANLPGATKHVADCMDFLASQIGWDEVCKVVKSREYVNLRESNMICWNLIEKAMRDECKASDVDFANQRRYAAKKALQKRFWPERPLCEVKSTRPMELVTKENQA